MRCDGCGAIISHRAGDNRDGLPVCAACWPVEHAADQALNALDAINTFNPDWPPRPAPFGAFGAPNREAQ